MTQEDKTKIRNKNSMKKYFFKIKGRQYDVEVKSFEDGVAQVDVNGTVYDVEVGGEGAKKMPVRKAPVVAAKKTQPASQKTSAPAGGGAKGGVIKAPLPGAIIKINVAVGDTVNAGDTVMVMEAMKMENNIQAESAGTVKAIKPAVGDTVMQDDVLIELGA